jgi:hypothetical protein
LPAQLKGTRWSFFALCLYLLSQAYTIPVLPIGPWALWPKLSDFAAILLVVAYVVERRYTIAASRPNRELSSLLFIFLGLGLLSYVWYLALLTKSGAVGVSYGVFQIYTLLQFIAVFWVAARIPLVASRISILRPIAVFVLVFVCFGIILTYLNIVRLPMIAPQIPASPDVSGPWADFSIPEWQWARRGWGTIGYNHSYVAAQVLMLIALVLHLSPEKSSFSDSALLLLALFAGFLTDARSSLAAIILFAMIYWSKRPQYAIAAVAFTMLVASFALLVAPDSIPIVSELSESVERQSTLLDATNADNLSGRDHIWKERLEFLDEKPLRWLLGSGFGAAVDSGNFAHMLFLHIIVELGLVGLAVFLILFLRILYHSHHKGSAKRSIFWVTIALLFASLTQETFYPVAAMGHFFGFYLFSVAIALRETFHDDPQRPSNLAVQPIADTVEPRRGTAPGSRRREAEHAQLAYGDYAEVRIK